MSESQQAVDPHLQQFIEVQTQKRRFQVLVHQLTDTCWDLCAVTPSSRLESRTSSCLTNCVERFLDTTNYIVNRFQKTTEFGFTGSE